MKKQARTVRSEKHRLCASPSRRAVIDGPLQDKNPPDSPGDLPKWRATAINSCEPSTSNKNKNTLIGDESPAL